MTYSSGELDQLITIKRAVNTEDGHGGYTSAWIDLLPNIPAMVKPLSGREQVQAEKVTATALYRFVVRSTINGAFNHNDVVLWNNVEFNIREIMPFPRSSWLEFVGEMNVAI